MRCSACQAMALHQMCQFLAIDEAYRRQMLCRLHRFDRRLCERRGGDEQSLDRSRTQHRPAQYIDVETRDRFTIVLTQLADHTRFRQADVEERFDIETTVAIASAPCGRAAQAHFLIPETFEQLRDQQSEGGKGQREQILACLCQLSC